MHAEIISIGSEILLGEIIDTNSAAIAKKLHSVGLPTWHFSSVGDHLDRIVEALRLGLSRSDLIITTGGLGPTVDDMTRQAIANAVGQPLEFDAELLAQIEERFRRWGRTMTANNRQQAYRPQDSIPIANPVGTAPCFIVEHKGHALVCLPGVPREMEYLLEHAVLPFARQRFGLTGVIKSRALNVAGIGESQVDALVGDLEQLHNPAVGLNAHSGVVVVRITATAASPAEADALIAPVEAAARERLGDSVFGTDEDTLAGAVLALLNQRGETLAVAECGTAGRLAGKLAAAGNAAFQGGRMLATPAGTPQDWARQAAAEAQADWGLACAITGGDGEIGLEVAYSHGDHGESQRRGFGGHQALAPEWSANVALDKLRRALMAEARIKP
ncbi:MAG: CinA family nicotinamide mononucleotide deamidase-related protein [Candidatus Methylumidiphilus sp.]